MSDSRDGLEVESMTSLSREDVGDVVQSSTGAATERSSVNWEFTEIADCCCGFQVEETA